MSDSQLIDSLGGTAAVAALLQYDKANGGVQRVHNWRTRGIPAAIKLAHPALFLQGVADAAPPPHVAPAPQELRDAA